MFHVVYGFKNFRNRITSHLNYDANFRQWSNQRWIEITSHLQGVVLQRMCLKSCESQILPLNIYVVILIRFVSDELATRRYFTRVHSTFQVQDFGSGL